MISFGNMLSVQNVIHILIKIWALKHFNYKAKKLNVLIFKFKILEVMSYLLHISFLYNSKAILVSYICMVTVAIEQKEWNIWDI